jgi:sulfoxide reductase heme-binding subunit YedZ
MVAGSPGPASTTGRAPAPALKTGGSTYGSIRTWKRVVFAAGLLPCVYLLALAAAARLGANPIEAITLFSGRWTLRFLLLTLAVTPARRLFHWNAVIQFRRMLGLFTFFYASLHLLTYVVLDQFFDWATIVEDVTKRPFIMAGMGAFLLMTPLALTSTRASIRRLGRRWAQLHMLIYPAAILGVVHFIWKVKSDLRSPTRYALLLAILLGIRLIHMARTRAR